MKTKLIIICGPTATGKTKVAVALAKLINGEIISCDSMQVYKDMNIGTAKVTLQEQQGIKHHLIDIINPSESFSCAEYKELAIAAIKDITSRKKQVIIAGGTGLYMNSLIENISFSSVEKNEKLRQELHNLELANGKGYLKSILKTFDEEMAEKLPENDLFRIIRAIEIYKTTGITQTAHNLQSRQGESEFLPIIICLTYNTRATLYEKINMRVDEMVKNGLVDEVVSIKDKFGENSTALAGIGYKEIVGYLDGGYSLEKAIEMIKQGSRRYAKRQITWFKRYEKAHFINVDTSEDINTTVLDFLKKYDILKEV